MSMRAGRAMFVVGLLLAFAPDARSQYKLPAGARHRLGDGSNPLTSVAFSPDGKTLALAGYDNWIELWDPVAGNKNRRWKTPEGCVVGLSFSPDGRLLASGGIHDSIVHLWEPGTGSKVRDFEGLRYGASSIAFSPDGRYLAAGGYGVDAVYLWEVASGKAIGPLVGPEVPDQSPEAQANPFLAYSHVAFAPDGKSMVSGHLRGLIRIWDMSTRSESRHFRGPDADVFVHVAYSADSQLIVSWGDAIRLWKTLSGTQFVANWGESLGLWKPNSGNQIRAFGQQPELRVAAAAISSDGRVIASGSSGQFLADNVVHLWETATGSERCQLEGHDFGISATAFSPDGSSLASASRDGTVILWDMKSLPLGTPEPSYATREEMESCWGELGHSDAGQAYRAIRVLCRFPRLAIPVLQQRLRPLTPVSPELIQKWVIDLDSKNFNTRENAARDLALQCEIAEPVLRSLLTKDLRPEAHRRLSQILGFSAIGGLVPAQLQLLRAVEVLECTATAEALLSLEKMASGDPRFLVTREAKSALARRKSQH